MNTFEVLWNNRWILKAKDRDLYYKVKDDIGAYKQFLAEKLGYQVMVNPYLIKMEKIPARPKNWMGITEFTSQMEYVFFCLILMYLEDKETEYQFVLSSITEYIQSHWKEEKIDWTIFTYRKSLIRVMKYMVSNGMIQVNDGNEDGFAKDMTSEVLYENTGVSKFFMRNFSKSMVEAKTYEDLLDDKLSLETEDETVRRRQFVYRTLLLDMAFYQEEAGTEAYAYIKKQRNMMQGEFESFLPCELQVYRSGTYLVLGEGAHLGQVFPEDNSMSDIILLLGSMVQARIEDGKYQPTKEEMIHVSFEEMEQLIAQCKSLYGRGFAKKYRDMTTKEFVAEVLWTLIHYELIEKQSYTYKLRPVFGKLKGAYPKEFNGKEETNEQ